MSQRLGVALLSVTIVVLILSRAFSSLRLLGSASALPRGAEVWMPVLISLVLLAAAVWVILSGRYGDATQKWAFGAAGSILGYWLNTGQ